jgi:hypothetical protein
MPDANANNVGVLDLITPAKPPTSMPDIPLRIDQYPLVSDLMCK